jgi:hypothetical protein
MRFAFAETPRVRVSRLPGDRSSLRSLIPLCASSPIWQEQAPLLNSASGLVASRCRSASGAFATTSVGGTFKLAYLVRNRITNLTTQDEQVDCFRNVAAHLEPGGCFVYWVVDGRLETLSASGTLPCCSIRVPLVASLVEPDDHGEERRRSWSRPTRIRPPSRRRRSSEAPSATSARSTRRPCPAGTRKPR